MAAGIEICRRRKTSQPAGFVLGVLVGAVVLSLAAQVAEAEPTVWGWTVAALSALGFLALVKIVLSRTPATPSHSAADIAEHKPAAKTSPTKQPTPRWPRPRSPDHSTKGTT